ncbi:hypothetical protein ACFX19_044665 [Malus domestica]
MMVMNAFNRSCMPYKDVKVALQNDTLLCFPTHVIQDEEHTDNVEGEQRMVVDGPEEDGWTTMVPRWRKKVNKRRSVELVWEDKTPKDVSKTLKYKWVARADLSSTSKCNDVDEDVVQIKKPNLHRQQQQTQQFNHPAANSVGSNFDDSGKRKKSLIREIEVIQNGVMKDYSHNNLVRGLEVESKLTANLHTILKQEETMWAQKAKVNWRQLGDKNTRFFHTMTTIRKKRNEIVRVKNNLGIPWKAGERLEQVFVHNFKMRFSCAAP